MNTKKQPPAATPCDELRPSDAAHELRIKRLGEQMLHHHTQWATTGCFAARGSADGYRLQMQEAIGQRDPAVIELMEVQRGLA